MKNWSERQKQIVIGAVILALVAGWFFFPAFQAERRYSSAPFISWEKCNAAQDAGDAYASFGLRGKAHEWREKATTACAFASIKRD